MKKKMKNNNYGIWPNPRVDEPCQRRNLPEGSNWKGFSESSNQNQFSKLKYKISKLGKNKRFLKMVSTLTLASLKYRVNSTVLLAWRVPHESELRRTSSFYFQFNFILSSPRGALHIIQANRARTCAQDAPRFCIDRSDDTVGQSPRRFFAPLDARRLHPARCAV
jgi:hypothetical protein